MPFDRFDVWPSPSPEAVVRSRVLAVSRRIHRRRLVPVVVVLLLASAAAVQRFAGHDDASRVHVVDSGRHDVESDVPASSLAPDAQPGPSDAVGSGRRLHSDQPEPSEGGGHGSASTNASKSNPPPALWSVSDPAGDGLPTLCPSPCVETSTDTWRSQAALDWVAGDVVGRNGRLSATMHLLDLAKPLDPDVTAVGKPATHEKYGVKIGFPDGRAWVSFVLRDIRTGVVTVENFERSPSSPYDRPVSLTTQTVEVDLVHSEIRMSVDYADVNRVIGGMSPRLSPGATVAPEFTTYADNRPDPSSDPSRVSAAYGTEVPVDQPEPDRKGASFRLEG